MHDNQALKSRSVKVLVQFLMVAIMITAGYAYLPATKVVARPNLLPTSSVSLNVPTENLLGEPVTFSATFTNNGDEPGYGPYIDLILPATGADGNDGLTYASATYLGRAVNPAAQVFTFPAPSGCVNHPLAVNNVGNPIQVCGTIGDQLVVFQLPFGSFVAGQTPITLQITALMSNLADTNYALPIRANGGYQYGRTQLNDPATDPSIIGPTVNATVTPTLFTLTKTYQGPENETATGPNFPHTYTISVNIANGQPITNFEIVDHLPNNIQYISLIGAFPGGYTTVQQPAVPGAQLPPNHDLVVHWPSITGTVSAVDATVTFSFFVPLNNAVGTNVIDPVTGSPNLSINDALARGLWNPIDVRDTPRPMPVISDRTNQDHILTDRSIAIQKSVSPTNGIRPGTVLTYTLDFQISDFFAYQNVVIQDLLSDGQRFDPSFTPTLTINGNKFSLPPAAMTNYSVIPHYSPNPPGNGTTEINFNVTSEMASRGQPGLLIGGCVLTNAAGSAPPALPAPSGLDPNCTAFPVGMGDGPTTGQIVFHTIIQENYTDTYPSGDPAVDQGDHFDNDVNINGDVMDIHSFVPNGHSMSDTSHSQVSIGIGLLQKTIYAVNGNTGYTSPVQVAPGDQVTYRLRYTMVTSDVENFQLTDYLPLPVFHVSELNGASFTAANVTPSATPPAGGQVQIGPSDTFSAYLFNQTGRYPAISTNSPGNYIHFSYGNVNGPDNDPKIVDILLTVTVQPDPFADGLFLTNQAESQEGTTFQATNDQSDIVQIQITEPVLRIRKGVVASNRGGVTYTPAPPTPAGVIFSTGGCGSGNAPFNNPINSTNLGTTLNSNITANGPDAGDTVTFAIVVENIGTGLNGAFDVEVRDVLPTGLTFVTGTLCVYDGARSAIANTDVDGSNPGLFAGGIRLTDPGPTATPAGALDPYSTTNGRNIAIITFDALVGSGVVPRQVLTNNATLLNYSGAGGGNNYVPGGLTDPASITIRNPIVAKTLVGTQFNTASNANNQVVIGEWADYQLTITVPEGVTPNARIVDNLDAGLAFVDCTNITINGSIVTNLSGGFTAACNDTPANPGGGNPAISNSGRTITFTLGDITNSDRDNTVAETIVIQYRVVTTNIASNHQIPAPQRQLRNTARFYWSAPGSPDPWVQVNAPYINVIEPVLAAQKNATINGGGVGSAGDQVIYTLHIHQDPTSATDAYNVTINDPLPLSAANHSLIIADPNTATPVSFNVTNGAGVVTNANFQLTGSDAAGWVLQSVGNFDLPRSNNQDITITITGWLSAEAQLGQTITNTERIEWTSMPGNPGQISQYDTNSTERTGTGTPAVNNYFRTAPGSFLVSSPNAAKQIISTSELFTSDPDVAVGEMVTYRLSYQLPEGTALNTTVTDVLDAGMAFVRCDNIVAQGTFALTATCADATFSPEPPASPTPENQARRMTIPFGNLITDGNPTTPESIIITYTSVVLNSPQANAGALLHNTATAAWTSAGHPVSVNVTGPQVHVVEPQLQIQKTANPTSGDAGDIITFTVTVTSQAGPDNTEAFNAIWNDMLPAELTYIPNSLAQTSGPPVTLNAAAPQLNAIWAAFPTGQTAVLQFQASLAQSVAPQQVIPNTARVTWTSLPPDVPNPQTLNNALSCERSGDGAAACGGATNDYAQANQANVTIVGPAIAKVFIDSSAPHTNGNNLTIGEVATYDLTITLPEGTTTGLQVIDQIPPGMQFVSAAMNRTGFVGNVPDPTLTVAGGNGDDAIFDFGPITVTGDNIAANNTFIIRIQAFVLNVPGNLGLPPQTQLTNQATLQVGSGPLYTSNPVAIHVVEPQLVIDKQFHTPPDTNPDTANDDTAAPNDIVTIELTVNNTGTSDAFDVSIEDLLPGANFTDITEGTTPAGFSFSAAPSGTDTLVRYTGGTIQVNTPVTFYFTARVLSIQAGQVLPNTATVTQATTLPGSDPNERDEPDVHDIDNLIGLGVDLAVTKDDGLTTVAPGQTITYQLGISNNSPYAADAPNVVVTENIPPYTTFNGPAGWTCNPGDRSPTTCHYNIPLLAAGASINLTFQVVVDSFVPANINTIDNAASVAYDGSRGPESNPNNNDAIHQDNIVAAPQVNVVKSSDLQVDADNDGHPSPGDTLRYTIVITNTGNRSAAGIVFTDNPDNNSTLIPGTVTVNPGGTVTTGNNPGDTSVVVNVGTVAGSGGTATITFDVTINNPLPPNVEQVRNQGTLRGSNLPVDIPTNPVIDPVTAQPDLHIEKVDDVATTITPGSTITYTITYTNAGALANQTAAGVVITENVPQYTTFSGPAGWTCAPSNRFPSTCTQNIGDLPVGTTGQLSFSVIVDNTLPAGVTQIHNAVLIADDHNNLDDPTPGDENATEDTPVDATPDLSIQKDDNQAIAGAGQTLSYTITYANTGNQEATGVVITEHIPQYTSFSAPAGWTCTPDIHYPSTCTYNVGNLPAGTSNSVNFTVLVNDAIPTGVEQIHNSVHIEDDHANGPDPTPGDEDASTDTPLSAVPDLVIHKTDGLTQVSSGSQLTYVLTIQNIGAQEATGVQVTDTIPTNTTFISASDGGTFNAGVVTWPLFNLTAGQTTVRSASVHVNDSLALDTRILNQADVHDDGKNGDDPNTEDNHATDEDRIGEAGKTLASTNQSFTHNSDVAIGEILTYEVTFTLEPHSSLDQLTLTDILDQGLAFEDCEAVIAPAGVTSSLSGGFADACQDTPANPSMGNPAIYTEPIGSSNPEDAGRKLVFNFGAVSNSNDANAVLQVRYRAVVIDSASNVRGTQLKNQAAWDWLGGSLHVAAPPVTILEPKIKLSKSVSPTTAFPGTTVTFKLTLSHTKQSNTDAFDLVMSDIVPKDLKYIPGTLRFISGQVPTRLDESASPTLTVGWDLFSLLDNSGNSTGNTIIEFKATVSHFSAGDKVTNTAGLAWTSIPGDHRTPQSPYNNLSSERYYDPASNINIYGVRASATFGMPEQLPATGFAPDRVTDRGQAPTVSSFDQSNNLHLEIPSLGINLPIVGVPFDGDQWDLTWLDGQAGYLEGTAFPTWNGNSFITAHVYDAEGQPGPFINLHNLKYGDEVIVTLDGQRYRYEVRQVLTLQPDDLSIFNHEDKSWVTLLTCQGFDPLKNKYDRRVAVRAVLTSIQ